ncbi:MAG TPA: bifunctional DNA-formamidopyrimidine glycosylase/DNA-(apurinic or apyrimidinic site) lyase [Burkholderiales bacterium]|nr:bifunctional DNA-formamidopyrimidine glycosylase/DNA-(apurinic or apyrimidinic site) lyase [Burkholderiales bacterium]
MPELPEVETTRRGLAPHVLGERISTAVVRNHALRLPVPRRLPQYLAGQTIATLTRRGKYLLFGSAAGTLIVHLGMSGRLWIVGHDTPPEVHDHFDLVLTNGTRVRLRDPRRFGLLVWETGDPLRHALLEAIGPEPFDSVFSGAWLHRVTRSRHAPVKQVLMDARVVAGVGNIYASESLFRAGIHPRLPAYRIGLARYARLADAVRETLQLAIDAGGSTLRDYVGGDGMAGSFQRQFMVYDRGAEPCFHCGVPIRTLRQGQRATFYCVRCQH